MPAEPPTDRPLHVLAVADSDSYLKWACATLRTMDDASDVRTSAVIVRNPLAPTPEQVDAAVAGTDVPPPRVVGPGRLRRLADTWRPDVVLVAATGPVAEMVARAVAGGGARRREGGRPALVTGLPGVALPATATGTGWRRWCDAFVVHGRREVEAYRSAFEAHGTAPAVVLSRLPFLGGAAPGADREIHRVVFAPQALVPADREDRVRLLRGLAALTDQGFETVVKLRARAGERQTHNERYPLDALWDAVHDDLGRPHDAIRFVDGPMARWLTPGTALATVSSTAALEAMARGLPTVLVDDFGVSDRLLNEPFVGSGCLVSLADLPVLLRTGGPTPDPGWTEDNYLHAEASALPTTVRNLARRRRAGQLRPVGRVRPLSWPRHAWTTVRSTLPTTLSRRLVRRVR
ncbi:DUF6716 putative glycosyltransferase [Isoptericola haloaureus]|uniref:DUF6716 putative glycosyltransferase n=1 Tax=Isoptericola haloaureus TaxID=1542902 RepID=A0ABU7Z534_9MICO